MTCTLTDDVRARLARVRLLVLDVDGVLTDGSLYYTERGEEIKKFHVRDGQGIKLAQQAGIEVALMSGNASAGSGTAGAGTRHQTCLPGCRR